MSQHIPEYTDSDFERVLAREYPDGVAQEARAVLMNYGKEKYHSWPLRVRMACLKLAGGDIARLRKFVDAACGDPRDVLVWGEYSHSSRARDSDERAVAGEKDWKELQEWLGRN